MIEKIINNDKLYAIIVRAGNAKKEGVNFVTPEEMTQQVATMSHPKGYIIVPHIHNKIPREIQKTQEVLIINKGKLKVNFFDDEKKFIESQELSKGDIIILADGGHGFECIEDVEMIEVKQGPFLGEKDKTRF